MIVADASALVEFLLGGSRGRAVSPILLREEDRIQVPALVDVEVVQALRRLVRRSEMTAARAEVALALFADMPLTRHLMPPLLPRLWELRANLTAYDAAYIALAEALDCTLVTFDEHLERAPGHGARIAIPAPLPAGA